jgi:two-component system chemotaxis response regulator CheY
MNILIVDDSVTVRSVVKKSLAMAKVEVEEVLEAANGQEALLALEKAPADLILADIHMPVMNGVELLGRLRADPRWKEIPVVIVSSDGSATRLELLRARGARGFLRKPFTPEALKETIAGALTAGKGGT